MRIFIFARPLTQEEMAQRREAAIQRHLAKNSEQSQTKDTAATGKSCRITVSGVLFRGQLDFS